MKKYKKIKLLNGAWLYYVKNTISNVTAVEINFPSGSRSDGDKPGLAHFVEHMFFTGTDQYNKEQLFKKYYDFIDVNATTWPDKIAFVGKVFNKEFADYIDLVSHMITKSTFSDEAIAKEKDVVKQEIVRGKDNFSRFAYCNLCYNIYNTDNYKYTTLGLEETVDSITRDDVLGFVSKYFVANNCAIMVSSPYSASKIKRIINNNLISRLPTNQKLVHVPLRNEKCESTTFFNHKVVDIEKTYFYTGFKVNRGVADWKFFTKLDLLLDMMNGSEGICKTMRLEKGLVYGCGFWFFSNRQDAIIIFETNMDRKNLKACEETLAEYIVNIRDNGFTEEQFKQAKRSHDHNKASSEPRVNRTLDKLDTYWRDNQLTSVKELRKVRDKFTLQEANAMVKEIFTDADICLTTYGNTDKDYSYSKSEFNKMFK